MLLLFVCAKRAQKIAYGIGIVFVFVEHARQFRRVLTEKRPVNHLPALLRKIKI